jgi:hypothetical protein
MRGAALQLASAMLVAGAIACGRTNLSEGPAEPPGGAFTPDAAAPDANLEYVEAAVTDSYASADQGIAADSALGASSVDAAEGGSEANTDASTSDAGDANDAGDASGAVEQRLPCDECGRGEQQCGPLPQVCTYNDAGVPLSCGSPGRTIWTCVAGDAGCAVWDKGLACRPDIPCCVTCMYILICPVGSDGDPCRQDTDCVSDACDAITHECVSNQCGDRHQDGEESDVDCGGPYCNSCGGGKRCQGNFDCLSGHLCASSHVCE